MSDRYKETHQDDLHTMQGLMPIWKQSFKNRENYKGQWTEETLSTEIDNYFQYCFDNDVKPCKAGLAMWLGTTKQGIWEWENNPAKYGFKCELIKRAGELIEMSYVGRVETYPTGNIFLLKASHGYAETTKVEVTGNQTSTADVADAISKLGLDKK